MKIMIPFFLLLLFCWSSLFPVSARCVGRNRFAMTPAQQQLNDHHPSNRGSSSFAPSARSYFPPPPFSSVASSLSPYLVDATGACSEGTFSAASLPQCSKAFLQNAPEQHIGHDNDPSAQEKIKVVHAQDAPPNDDACKTCRSCIGLGDVVGGIGTGLSYVTVKPVLFVWGHLWGSETVDSEMIDENPMTEVWVKSEGGPLRRTAGEDGKNPNDLQKGGGGGGGGPESVPPPVLLVPPGGGLADRPSLSRTEREAVWNGLPPTGRFYNKVQVHSSPGAFF